MVVYFSSPLFGPEFGPKLLSNFDPTRPVKPGPTYNSDLLQQELQ